jgi:uncharacterized protein
MPETVAVIGSGLAGLTTAFLLSPSFTVTLIERTLSAGVDIASVVTDDGIVIDSPMRGIQKEYYPSLFELVQFLGLETFVTNVDTNYYSWDGCGEENASFLGTTAFMHRLSFLKLPGLLYDWIKSSTFLKTSSLELARLYITALALKSSGKIALIDQTFGKYLDFNHYSASFKYKFLAPFLCGIATCSVEDVMEYPAAILLDVIATYGSDIYQIKGGISSLVDKLIDPVSNRLFSTTIVGCWKDKSGMIVTQDSKGIKRTFDKIVFATPGSVITKILSAPPPHGLQSLNHLSDPLTKFKFIPVRVVVHSDPSILPISKKTWKSINFGLDSCGEIMSTQWINSLQNVKSSSKDYFETSSIIVNPYPNISKPSIISEHVFQRGLVNLESLDGIDEIERVQGVNGVYVAGSWVWPGMPLLEGCIASSLRIADRLGVQRRFGNGTAIVDGRYESLVKRFLRSEMNGTVKYKWAKGVVGMCVCYVLQVLTIILGLIFSLSQKIC